MSKSLALCSAVRKFFSRDKRSGATVTEEKIKGEYEPKASKEIKRIIARTEIITGISLLLSLTAIVLKLLKLHL